MNGVRIGNKHSYDDFGLILSSKNIGIPSVQTNIVTVPLRDGTIDLTESVTGTPKYSDRTVQMTFSVIDPIKTWSAKISEIENYLHGQKMKVIFDDDPSFYYIGRLSVNSWASNKNIGTLIIDCNAEPFKCDIESSADEWEWDSFDFENGIINETGNIVVEGTKTVTLICGKKTVELSIITSADMTVTYKGKQYTLLEGTQKMYDIFFDEGENVLTFNGYGTVTIDYRGGRL